MMLTFVMLALRIRGYRRTRNTLARLRLHKQPIPHNDAAVDALVGELAWSLAAVSHHYPTSTTCLQRTLALWWMLHRRGIASRIRIGTIRAETGILAHARLERDGVVINDDEEHTASFVAFSELD